MAQLKNTIIDDTGFIQLPVGTTAQRPGVGGQPATAQGQVRFNSSLNIVEWYDAELSNWFPTGIIRPVATGGTITDASINNALYRVHTFNSNGTLTLTRGGVVDYLIVGGGGAGGCSRNGLGGSGGGGGGGVLIGSLTLPIGDYPVVVGSGGIKPAANSTGVGFTGNPSSFAGHVAIGGGAGGNGDNTVPRDTGVTGASGGGGGYRGYTTQGNGGQPTLGQGFHGGNVMSGSASGGGGGGAGQAGFSNSNNGGPGNGGTGGEGGSGIFINFNGTIREYGKGGQGGSANIDGDPPANTGTGGRGAYAAADAHRNGASGIVIIRYRID